MRATKKEEELIHSIYRELYKEATPSADLDKLVEDAVINSRGEKDIGFDNYEIAEPLFNQIIEKHLKTHKMTKLKQRMLINTILMGCSPRFKK